jgi:glutamine amidotransferase
MSVLVIDYGMSNLGSIKRSLEECDADVLVSCDPKDIDIAASIVLPGVGSFADGMANLNDHGWSAAIRHAVIECSIPILGICLGMQLLADIGYEGGKVAGLGLIRGEVERLIPDSQGVRIPHVGWNEIHRTRSTPLFEGIADGSDFYFVHSYHFIPKQKENVIAETPYCGGFVSAVSNGNIYGVQFHPEKSQRIGFKLLDNFLRI